MSWKSPKASYIFIFGVGRGNSTFIRSGLNHGFIVDMGASDDFSPADFMRDNLIPMLAEYSSGEKYKARKLAQIVLSHPHTDHLSEIGRIEPDGEKDSPFEPALLTCPHDKPPLDGMSDEALNWSRIKNPGGAETLVETYKSLYKSRTLPLQTIKYALADDVPGLEYGIYYVRPPVCDELHPKADHDYGNATSLVFYYRYGKQSVLLPADITPAAIEQILFDKDGTEKRYTIFDKHSSDRNPEWHSKTLDQPSLSSRLGRLGLTVLVAPHHGLESCYSEDLYKSIKGKKPSLVVLSEKRKSGPHDGKTDSRYTSDSGASGLEVDIEGKKETRTYLSTSNGSNILVVFHGSDDPPKVYVRKKAVDLMAFAKG